MKWVIGHNSVSPCSFFESLGPSRSIIISELEGRHNWPLLLVTLWLDTCQNVRGVLVVLLVAGHLRFRWLSIHCLVLVRCHIRGCCWRTSLASHVQAVMVLGHLLLVSLEACTCYLVCLDSRLEGTLGASNNTSNNRGCVWCLIVQGMDPSKWLGRSRRLVDGLVFTSNRCVLRWLLSCHRTLINDFVSLDDLWRYDARPVLVRLSLSSSNFSILSNRLH